MSRRCRRAILAIVGLLIAGLIAVQPAAAHNWTSYYTSYDPTTDRYYPTRWSQTMIPWQFGEHYAGSGQQWRDRAEEAVRLWSDATQGHILFSRVADDQTPINTEKGECEGSRVDDTGISVVRRHWTDWGYLGWLAPCYATYADANGNIAITGFVLTITSTVRWQVGDGYYTSCEWNATLGTPADDQCDLMSTLVHEFGHAMGHSYHFDDLDSTTPYRDPSVCKPNVGDADHQTLCEGTYVAVDSTYLRTLEFHDLETLRAAYADWPPPPPPPPPPPTSTTTTVTTPPSNGGGLPDNHCYTLNQPASGGLFGVPLCAV